jgi:hypothetical protein
MSDTKAAPAQEPKKAGSLENHLTEAGVDVAAAKAALAELDASFGGETGAIPDGALQDWANAHFDSIEARKFFMALGREWESEAVAKLPADRKWERGPKAAEAKAKRNQEEWEKRHGGKLAGGSPAPQDFGAAARATEERLKAEAKAREDALPGHGLKATSKAEAEHKVAVENLQDSTENVGGVGPLTPKVAPDNAVTPAPAITDAATTPQARSNVATSKPNKDK